MPLSRKYVGAIDQGTTSTRFILFNRTGSVKAVHQLEHRQVFPEPGHVEHDQAEILDRTCQVIRGALRKSGIRPGEIAALGVTNQRETTVVWNRRTGKPYHNALVWQDTRTAALCEELSRSGGGQDRFRDRTGLPLATYFSGPKIRWLLDRIPGLRQAAENGDALFGNMDTWIIWNLTGGPRGGSHVTDVTNASRTLLFNLRTLDWDRDILSELDIPRAMLPEIRPSSDPNPYGKTTREGPFKSEIPITGDLGDQQAALFGQTCFDTGDAKNTYGTGCFLLLNTGEEPVMSRNGLVTTLGYRIGKEKPVYALEGSVAIAGALVQWVRDNLKMIRRASDIDKLAAQVPDNGGVYFVPAFSGLYAPYWKSSARGVVAGLTRFADRRHLARAVLEATAFQTREIFDAMKKDSGIRPSSLKADGGMVASDILMQFQADILGVPVVRPKVAETTALGAAYAAGLAAGFWKDKNELRSNWKARKTWTPAMDTSRRDELVRWWLKAVSRSFDWTDPA